MKSKSFSMLPNEFSSWHFIGAFHDKRTSNALNLTLEVRFYSAMHFEQCLGLFSRCDRISCLLRLELQLALNCAVFI